MRRRGKKRTRQRESGEWLSVSRCWGSKSNQPSPSTPAQPVPLVRASQQLPGQHSCRHTGNALDLIENTIFSCARAALAPAIARTARATTRERAWGKGKKVNKPVTGCGIVPRASWAVGDTSSLRLGKLDQQ